MRSVPWLVMVLLLASSGCGGEASGTDAGLSCAASKQSGIWLVPFGPVSQEINVKGSVSLKVVVVRGSEKEGEGKPVVGRTVSVRIINQEGDASLDLSGPVTDADGFATAKFAAGGKPGLYQVEASTTGTCARTFSIDVREAPRQLRVVTKTPRDTFTRVKLPVVVVALQVTTRGSAKLAGEEISFSLGLGKSDETKLYALDGSGGAQTLKVTTNASGMATAVVSTGTLAIPELQVLASMVGTADAEVKLRVAVGKDKPCQGAGDCPLGYTCKAEICEEPPVTPPTGCTSNSQCAAPTICQVSTGQCLQPTGQSCDPVEGLGCAAGDVCVGGQCARLPGTCVNNAACPLSFVCTGGKCVPGGKPPTGGCVTNTDCPTNNACINGECKPKAACTIAHQPDRLQGTWKLSSTLHLGDAVNPLLGGLLGAAGVLRDLLEGRFGIKGVPSFIASTVEKYLRTLISQYVPAWGQKLIIVLGDLNDIASNMQVFSTVVTSAVGNDGYVNNEQWDLVVFNYKGKQITTPPSAIPEIGDVIIPPYASREVCGVLFIDKHHVNNVIGGLVKFAVETALAAATCSGGGMPCFDSVAEALDDSIDCASLGSELETLIYSLWSSAPSTASTIEAACTGQKKTLITLISNQLASLTTKLQLLELSGVVNIPSPGADSLLQNGKWYGVLGGASFEGEFAAQR